MNPEWHNTVNNIYDDWRVLISSIYFTPSCTDLPTHFMLPALYHYSLFTIFTIIEQLQISDN